MPSDVVHPRAGRPDAKSTASGMRGRATRRALGRAALFGGLFSLACDVAMWFLVDGYDPLAQTISELGAGPHHWLQDLGIVAFAIGMLSLASCHYLHGDTGLAAWVARLALVLLAMDVSLVSLWNEYGDGQPGGLVIHGYLVRALYVLVPVLMWSAASASLGDSRAARLTGKAAAVLWVLLAPVYLFVPAGFDGAYERLPAIAMIGTVAALAWRLLRAVGGDEAAGR